MNEQEFIDNFSIELTNTTVEERKEIGKKYYKQLKRLEQENKELKELKCKFKEYCTCDTERLQAENEENLHYLACMTEQRNKLQTENEKKDNLLKWLITQQYYIIPKKLKQKITEVLNG